MSNTQLNRINRQCWWRKLGRVSQIPYLLTVTKVAWNLIFLCAKNYLRLFLNEIAMAFFARIELKRLRKRNLWPIPVVDKPWPFNNIFRIYGSIYKAGFGYNYKLDVLGFLIVKWTSFSSNCDPRDSLIWMSLQNLQISTDQCECRSLTFTKGNVK